MRAVETKVWTCSTCKRWSEDLAAAEACCTCRLCGKQIEPKSGQMCDPCREIRWAQYKADDRAKHAKLTPVSDWDYALAGEPEDVISDGYQAIELAQEELWDDGVEDPTRDQVRERIESWLLVPAGPDTLPEFDVADFLSDHMPEGWDGSDCPDLQAAQEALNKAIRELKDKPLVPIKGQRVDVDALMNECWKGVP